MPKSSRSPAAARGNLSWSVERRLAFVEERLFWLGSVNRQDLADRFGTSMSQASLDIARYLALKPADVTYDKSAKHYVAGADYVPLLMQPDAGRYLGELRLVEAGVLSEGDTLLGSIPPFDATPVPVRRIDPIVLRDVLHAIRGGMAIAVYYQSMSRERPAQRVIEPHALAFDGFRWHARAYDRETSGFRDFVLGRLSKIRESGAAEHGTGDDTDWNIFAELLIAPHPGLTPSQARAIALDYGIEKGTARLKVRRALLYYALKRLGLDHEADTRPPNVQQIVLVNRSEIAAPAIADGPA